MIDRKDAGEKSLLKDVLDSAETAINIDNIKEDIEDKLQEVDRKIRHIEELEGDVSQTLTEVQDKVDEMDMRMSIIELKLSGAVILGLLFLTVIQYQRGDTMMALASGSFLTLVTIETLITLYRSFVTDFVVTFIQKVLP